MSEALGRLAKILGERFDVLDAWVWYLFPRNLFECSPRYAGAIGNRWPAPLG